MATLYATDYAEIRLPVADHQLAYLQLPSLRGASESEGPNVRLHARFAGADHEWSGRVVRTEGEIDARSRMVHVVARVEDPYRMDEGDEAKPPLAVGLFVQAEIEGAIAENVIVVPRYAMRDESRILIVDAEDRLYTREIEVLRFDRDDVLIRSELAPGERICVSPLQVVVEGMQVKPTKDDAAGKDGARS
jgi:multidrug efflux pump subunit AcrA (membrane-fusion protein)